MDKREKILARMNEHLISVLESKKEWVGLFLQGSQNYNLDYEGSDIDTKVIVLPSFEDFVLMRKPISYTHIMENNEHVDFKDTYKEGDKDIRNCHINIGTGKEITIRQLAERIVETVGYQGKLTFDSSKPDGTMRKLTDPSKLHSLGWHHKIEIEEGVRRMYEWYLK